MNRSIALLIFLCLILFSFGCSKYQQIDLRRNGKDTPPFITEAAVKAGSFAELGEGDTIAVFQGSVFRLEDSNEVLIALMAKPGKPEGDPMKSESLGAAKHKPDQSKAEGKKAEKQKPNPMKSEETRAAKQKPDPLKSEQLGARKNKEQKQEQPEKHAQQKQSAPGKHKHAALSISKEVALEKEGRQRFEHVVELKVDKDKKQATFRLRLFNDGDLDFQGNVLVLDHLVRGLRFKNLKAVQHAECNTAKKVMAFIPLLNLIALGMDDYTYTPIAPGSLQMEQQVDGNVLHFSLQKVSMPKATGIAIDFTVDIID
ncbi:hypothetical protein [Megalodesulfovibrio paquesii]